MVVLLEKCLEVSSSTRALAIAPKRTPMLVTLGGRRVASGLFQASVCRGEDLVQHSGRVVRGDCRSRFIYGNPFSPSGNILQ